MEESRASPQLCEKIPINFLQNPTNGYPNLVQFSRLESKDERILFLKALSPEAIGNILYCIFLLIEFNYTDEKGQRVMLPRNIIEEIIRHSSIESVHKNLLSRLHQDTQCDILHNMTDVWSQYMLFLINKNHRFVLVCLIDSMLKKPCFTFEFRTGLFTSLETKLKDKHVDTTILESLRSK
jgi:hypothetical protein